ncbi:SAM-dependent chlorinase/fluorinase [Planosporangium thailandense]|uniref:SAM-dependent chlorinase/fluorinase n=1 Tax=Planosporangium thailandense TaxID=765197 RepID=A0ABX0XR66_9ACTN|nr:SAM-dependent chlorinase/fluorinase [Planosporangium thailandense]NJC68283.1 SAM-dependent chlorinase/fluorinase [Planosporangium thailandense]
MPGYDWISFTTDYGLSDGFVAACHGVIARIAPAVRVIDVTHQVPPSDVSRGAAVLAQTVPHLPPAVHVAVVDPGVGTARRGVAIEAAQGLLVGPDNGLLPAAAEALGGIRGVVSLDDPEWFASPVSPTFHGRDIFAPVAARLATGTALYDAGAEVDPATLVRLPEPAVMVGEDWLEAEVTTVDRFGNVQLAAPGETLDRLGERVRIGGLHARRAVTFGDAPPGALVVYVDSADRVAIAINGGRAVVALGVAPGDLVHLTTA